jgi:hypothetical protein
MLCFQPNATGDIYTARKHDYTYDVFKEHGMWVALVHGPEGESRELGGKPMPTSYDAEIACVEYAWAVDSTLAHG